MQIQGKRERHTDRVSRCERETYRSSEWGVGVSQCERERERDLDRVREKMREDVLDRRKIVKS